MSGNFTFGLRALYVCFIAVVCSASHASDSAMRWIAFGDIRGNFEPCGCDPKTDLGGVQRIHSFVSKYQAGQPKTYVFHLGNAFSEELTDLSRQKNQFIRASMNLIQPDAYLLNYSELDQSSSMLPGLNYVLSNHTRKSTPYAFKEQINYGQINIFGFVEPSRKYKHLLNLSSSKLIDKVKAIKKSENGSNIQTVLLYSGSESTLKKILNFGVFNEVISASPLNLNAIIKGDERLNESKLIRVRLDSIEVLQTPLGGQGVLKSTELQRIESEIANSLKDAVLTSNSSSKVDCGAAGAVDSVLAGKHCSGPQPKFERSFVQWLGPEGSVDQGGDMLRLVEGYRSQSTERMKLLEQTRLVDLESSRFIGPETCKSCHASSYEIWAKSKHSRAFSTLEKKSRTSDPECVSCHVVGFSEKGGFVSSSKTPHLLNVQCENCHGPRKDHIESPSKVRKGGLSAKDSCKNCHTPPHSPSYMFEKYWKIIEHK